MKRTLLCLAGALLATSCATMINGKYQTISVDSFPSGAAVAVHCGNVPADGGATPAQVKVERAAKQCLLTLSQDGYEPRVVVLSHQVSRATTMNAAFGLPAAIAFGIGGAVLGNSVNGAYSGAEIGIDSGFQLGTEAANDVDKNRGGWKWVPGRIFVTLVRSEIAAEKRDSR